MPFGSNISGKFIQYKPVGAKNKKKYPFGIRKIHTGDIVASDLDLAFYSNSGKSYSNERSIDFGNDVNSKYFTRKKEVVRHGDNYNGELKGADGAIRVAKENEIIYIFNNKGFVEAGRYQDMVKKYIKGSKPGQYVKRETQGAKGADDLRLPKSVGAQAKITINSKIKDSNYAKRLAKDMSQQAQTDVDSLVKQLSSGNTNPGIGNRNLGSNFWELRGRNGGRVILKQKSAGEFDIVGKFQGHARGDTANSKIIQRLMDDYTNLYGN